MKRLSLLLVFGLIGLRPLGADVMLLDSGDVLDWVRIAEQSYPKYKDTMIRPSALLKFSTEDIPANAVIDYAYLRFRVLKCTTGATIYTSYVSDDTWSFDTTDPQTLYLWPVESLLGYYSSG